MQMAQMDEEEGGAFPTIQTLPVAVAELGRTTTIKGPGVSKGVSAYSGGMATQNYRRVYKAML